MKEQGVGQDQAEEAKRKEVVAGKEEDQGCMSNPKATSHPNSKVHPDC